MEDARQREILSRFFKTGEGQYGQGDVFLGLRVPQTRLVVKNAKGCVSLAEIEKLLYCEYHEVRLCGLLLLVEKMKAATPRRREAPTTYAAERQELAAFYLRHARRANNWDLVDLSAPYVLGAYLLQPDAEGVLPDEGVLDRLADSENLWEQRIAVVTTLAMIRQGQSATAQRIVTKLLGHPHDLIHKAMGWVLREIWKRDAEEVEAYLEAHYQEMPRTTLRYAIERMPEARRQYWLHKPPSPHYPQ